VRHFVRRFARSALLATGTYPTRLTDIARLQSLLSALRPREVPLRRLGPDGDGGYLVPDDLDDINACFSPGVSHRSGFERDCADLGMRVFLADRSVEGPADSHPAFHFVRKHVGVTADDETIPIDAWVRSTDDSMDDLLLQMDVEGHEYEVILGLSEAVLRRFRILVIEFHQLDDLLSAPFFRFASVSFEKLLHTHACVHIHPNNCCGMVEHAGIGIPNTAEFTFYRRDRLNDAGYASKFPHPLDHDNTRNPPLPLSRAWYT
jgi:hypothetical protein